jgi:autotransporter-associated beta strand protein
MLATASLAQAQQNVTTATWVGPTPASNGGTGIWDKWTGTPAHTYWRATNLAGTPLVNGSRLTNTSTLTFAYTGTALPVDPNAVYPSATLDLLVDSSNVSSQSQTLTFQSSGYRLLPGSFNTSSAEPLVSTFTDIDLAHSLALAPYLTTPNGTLQLGTVNFTVATPALATDPKPFVVLRNPTTASRISVTNAGTTVILESLVASTISGAFRGNGDITKTGGGVLQYQGHAGQMFGYNVALPYSYIQTPFGFSLSNPGTNNTYGLRPVDLHPNLTPSDIPNANAWRLSGLQGRVQVDAGLLMVSGHLNMWHDYGARVESQILAASEIPALVAQISVNAADVAGITYALAKRMTGASSIVLNGSAELSFTNTAAQVGALRLNFAHNLQAGDNNDQFQTTVTTGPDSTYRLGIHIDQDFVGSVGILAGGGKVIKTGAGTLRVLNDSRMTGDFIAGGGTTILESSTGLTFANSSSFNIAGTQDTADANGSQQTEAALGLSRRGADIRYVQVPSNSNNYFRWDYRPALFPDVGTLTLAKNATGQYVSYASTGAEVILHNDQTVRNFQADFALNSKGSTNVGSPTAGEIYTAVDAVRTAADVNSKGELVIPGTGFGGTLRLDGHTLTINQETGRDGYYNGTIFGYDSVNGVAGGRIIKTGAGTLVLLLTGGSAYDYTEIQGGTFIANVQGLGQKQVLIGDGGTFAILQNNAGTLSANLAGSAGSTLKLLASAVINNGSGAGIQVNPGLDPGEVNVINGQNDFYGNIVVNDGVDLSFTGGKNNTFINAASVTLDSGSTRETVLRFGDTNQLVRNLAGNDSARVELGRGDITLEQNANLTYTGSVTGVGSLIKQGSGTFVLAGTTGTNLYKDSYYGATIVRPTGVLAAGTANATPNTSALVIVGGGTYSNGNQAQVVGALFGSASAVLNLGSGSLTVGYTTARASSLTTELQGSNPLLADYLGTTAQFSPITALGTPVTQTSTGVAPAPIGTTSLALSSITNVAVGQAITGTGLAAGTFVSQVIAGGAATVTGTIASGALVLPTTNTAGLTIGQVVTGTGIPANTTITSITPNSSITLSQALNANASGTVTGAAGVILSTGLIAAAAPGTNFAITRTQSIDVSSLGLSAAELNDLYTGVLTMPALTSLYLNRVAIGTNIGNYVAPTAAGETAFATTRSFDGTITGSGALIKIGNEDLTLGGSSPGFTGQIQISGGVLLLAWNAVPNAPSILTTTPGILGVTVTDAYNPIADTIKRTFTTPILGSGSFIKRGPGYLILSPGVIAGQTPYTGTTTVQAGWLEMAALPTNGAAVINLETAKTIVSGAEDTNSVALTDIFGLTVGQTVLGLGVPSGTTITRVIATGTGTITGTVNLGATVLPMTNTSGLVVGQVVTGAGLDADTVITAISANTSITLSEALIGSATGDVTGLSGVTLSANLTTDAAGTLDIPAHLVLTTAADVTYTGAVSGAGQLEIRAGSKVLTSGGSLTHTGGTLIRTGTLLASTGWAGATTGDITVLSGATARLNIQLDKAITSGDINTATLVVGDVTGLLAGQVVVGTGIPAGTTILGINAGTKTLTLSANLTAASSGTLQVANTLTASGVFHGAGVIAKDGIGALTLTTATTDFAGTYRSLAGSTNLGSDNLFGDPLVAGQSIGAVDLQGSSVLNVLGGTDQTFRNLRGSADSTIRVAAAGSVLGLQVDANGAYDFLGRFQQGVGVTDATLVKFGTGTLSLAPTAGANSLGTIVVLEGKLVGTVAGYAAADIYVAEDATVAFHNALAGELNKVTFANIVRAASTLSGPLGTALNAATLGAGTVGKTGAGIVELTAYSTALDFNIEAGELRLADLRTTTEALLKANIAAGATFRVALSGDRDIGISGDPASSQISGAGLLDLRSDGAAMRIVTAYAQPGVATTNLGANVTLDISALLNITGITGDAGSVLEIGSLGGGHELTLTQSIDGSFGGTLQGSDALVIKGPGMFRYTGATSLSAPTTVTVLGGGLGVDVTNTKDVDLVKDTTLATPRAARLGVMVTAGTASYTGDVTGSVGAAEMIKLGAGTLDLTDAAILAGSTLANQVFGAYVVKEGTLAVTLDAAGRILPDTSNLSRPLRLEGGTLAVEVSAVGGTLQSQSVVGSTGSLNVTTNGANTATLTVLGDIGGNVTVAGGTALAVGASNLGVTIAGNVNVSNTSALRGSANIGGNLTVGAGATLAPGYSPGTFTAVNYDNAGVASMEVTGTPTGTAPNQLFNDSVQFSGVADLNNGGTGSLVIARWNAPTTTTAPAYGKRFVLFKDTAVDATPTVSESFTNLFPANAITVDPADTNGRYLIVEPRAVGSFPGLTTAPSEYAVYFVGGADRYAIAGVQAGIVSYIQSITKTATGGALANGGTTFLPSSVSTDANYLSRLAASLMVMDDASLAPAMRSLQPGSLAAIPATVALEQRAETDALQRRLDQRRYDRAGYSVYYNEFFVEATSTSFKGGSGVGAPPFDSTLTGLLGGYIKDLNPWSVAGFTLGASHTKSTLADAAGTVSGNAYRATAFFSGMLGERRDTFFLDAGISLGNSSNKSTRNTFMGVQSGSPSAMSYGGFARFGAGLATKGGVNFTPFVGLDMVRVNGKAFNETSGDPTALHVSSYSYTSARASTGTGMTWLSVHEGQMIKFAFDVEAFAELGGGKTADITANFENVGQFTTQTDVASGAGFRLIPSFTYGPNPDTAYYLTLTLEKSGSTKTTGIEAGYRRRF